MYIHNGFAVKPSIIKYIPVFSDSYMKIQNLIIYHIPTQQNASNQPDHNTFEEVITSYMLTLCSFQTEHKRILMTISYCMIIQYKLYLYSKFLLKKTSNQTDHNIYKNGPTPYMFTTCLFKNWIITHTYDNVML